MGRLNGTKPLSKNTGLVFSIIWFLKILQQSFPLLQSLKEPNLCFTRITARIQSLSSNLKGTWGRNLGSNFVFFHTLFLSLMQTLLALSWRKVCALKTRLMYFFQISSTDKEKAENKTLQIHCSEHCKHLMFFSPLLRIINLTITKTSLPANLLHG